MMQPYDMLDLIRWGEGELRNAGLECAAYDAKVLLRCSADAELFRDYIHKRASGYPLQYILMETEFMGLLLTLEQGVFIPRPETEILVERTLERIKGFTGHPVNILEIGTGSGNIAISLTKNVTNCKILASDISDLAIKTARQNAVANSVSEKVEFVKSDLFDNIPRIYINYFDIIISNPPYVRRAEIKDLQPEITYEDMQALDGGADGLGFYRRILDEGRKYLKKGGIFAFEIGCDQRETVEGIVRQYPELRGFEVFKDYNRHDRVVIVKKEITS